MRKNDAVFAAINRFRELEAGWDSYDAKPIHPGACNYAALILSSLPGCWSAVPCSDGSVQLELHDDSDVEIKITVTGS